MDNTMYESEVRDILETSGHDLMQKFYGEYGRAIFAFQYAESLVARLHLFLDHYMGTLKTPEEYRKRTDYLERRATIGPLVSGLFSVLPHYEGIQELQFGLERLADRRNETVHRYVDEVREKKHDRLFITKKIEQLEVYFRETTELNQTLSNLVTDYYLKPEVQEDLAKWYESDWGWSTGGTESRKDPNQY